MKLWVVLGILVAGLVSGCDTEEATPAGVLSVDSTSDTEVPEGLTARDVDHNKDGIINIQDLVIVSKFMGQKVADTTVASASDGSDPCQDIRAKRYDNLEIVDGDNADMTETFSAPNGNYVYALVAFQSWRIADPGCFALRLLIDDNMLPVAAVGKAVNGEVSNPFKASPFSLFPQSGAYSNPRKISAGSYRQYHASPRVIYRLGYICDAGLEICNANNLESSTYRQLPWDITVNSDFIFNYDISSYPEEDRSYIREWNVVERHKYYGKRLSQSGIPIGAGRTISRISILVKDTTGDKLSYQWEITADREIYHRVPINEIFADNEFNDKHHRDTGVYLKMLPAEVRRRYFPEDL